MIPYLAGSLIPAGLAVRRLEVADGAAQIARVEVEGLLLEAGLKIRTMLIFRSIIKVIILGLR